MARPSVPPRSQRRLIAVGAVGAVAMFSSFVHLVNAAVERGDATTQAVHVTVTAPR